MANPILGWQLWGNVESAIVPYSEYMCGVLGSWRDFSARLAQFLPLTGVGLVAVVVGVWSALLLPASAPKG